MSEIPCEKNEELRRKILDFAEVLKTEAHKLGEHGLDEQDFYQSGLFRGAIERIRGQFSASMKEKRGFVALVLDHMQSGGYIAHWQSAGEANRHDYSVRLNNGRTACIELKGCLDGNNTNIFERPPHADEFILWSVCSNPGADPRHNVWSGIHTRLSAEMIDRNQRIDGLVVWDWICGTTARPCPKLWDTPDRLTEVGPYRLPPPCIYLFPGTVPSVRNNPNPRINQLEDVGILQAMHACFQGRDDEVNEVGISVAHRGADTVRSTKISRSGEIRRASDPTPIRRA
ncbi:hypothetical protein [Pseudooceanicola nitratireducens]|uniref:hypothetical protein n=1 Tax=Pseudooceanicola nitratireducens TaxID=517719 RepID=UPI001C94B7B5|nr:hypothetical protein [Pseudooceanicola nitratireducens]MBY6158431.1 hypothetical protein [Pseudooceanicola nitratireducens]MEC7299747.1 hypothetical protein [Pseudomonadota bacterium]